MTDVVLEIRAMQPNTHVKPVNVKRNSEDQSCWELSNAYACYYNSDQDSDSLTGFLYQHQQGTKVVAFQHKLLSTLFNQADHYPFSDTAFPMLNR